MSSFGLALLSISMSVAAQFAFKLGVTSLKLAPADGPPTMWRLLAGVAGNPHILIGFALYGVGALVWLRVLAEWDVSKAYPMVGMGFCITAAVGLALGEAVGIGRLIGVFLICIGVFMVGRS